MIQINELLAEAESASITLTMPFELRQKSRLRTKLDNGEEVALVLPRGKVLRHGDCLKTDTGQVVEINAAEESVSTAYTDDHCQLAKACYHLGNRHVPLQVGNNWLRYQHDHVLDEMIIDLGLNVVSEQAPFEPESGAYSKGKGHHGHHHHD